MIDYDYLDWGVGLPIEDDFKKIEYREQAKVKLFEVNPDEVLYEEGKEVNDYDVWYLQLPTEKTWVEDSDQVANRRLQLEQEIADYAASIVPGHDLWRRGTSVFLDAFLLEPINDITETKYENVLLLSSEGICETPLAVIWEMVPVSKRNILMNVQRAGKKIYGVVNDKYCASGDGLLCLEVYGKK
jgi:hypothetical protein